MGRQIHQGGELACFVIQIITVTMITRAGLNFNSRVCILSPSRKKKVREIETRIHLAGIESERQLRL